MNEDASTPPRRRISAKSVALIAIFGCFALSGVLRIGDVWHGVAEAQTAETDADQPGPAAATEPVAPAAEESETLDVAASEAPNAATDAEYAEAKLVGAEPEPKAEAAR